MCFVMSLLVVPIAAVTMAKLLHYGYSKKRFIDVLPLLFIQINSLYIWACTCIYFIIRIDRSTSFSKWLAYELIGNAVFLEPLNSFLYTWRCLDAIVQDSQGAKQKLLAAFRLISIVLVPFITITMFICFAFAFANFYFL